MPVKRKSVRPRKKHSKLLVFLLGVMIIGGLFLLAVSAKYDYLSFTTPKTDVAGVTSSSSGEIKPGKAKPSVYVTSETLSRNDCYPGFQSISFTCSDGFQSSYTPTTCTDPFILVRTAEKTCMQRGITPKPSRAEQFKLRK